LVVSFLVGLALLLFSAGSLEGVGFYGFKRGGTVREPLGGKVHFQLGQKALAFQIVFEIDGHAALKVRSLRSRSTKSGAGQPT
jgi:maltoporin